LPPFPSASDEAISRAKKNRSQRRTIEIGREGGPAVSPSYRTYYARRVPWDISFVMPESYFFLKRVSCAEPEGML